eukprot:gene25612-biopygen19505
MQGGWCKEGTNQRTVCCSTVGWVGLERVRLGCIDRIWIGLVWYCSVQCAGSSWLCFQFWRFVVVFPVKFGL